MLIAGHMLQLLIALYIIHPATTLVYKALLVEPNHKLKAMSFVIDNALQMLPDHWFVLAIIPQTAFDSLCPREHWCSNNRFEFRALPEQRWSKDIYQHEHWRNVIFRTAAWWASLGADIVLTIQCDTLICRHGDPPQMHKHVLLGGPSIKRRVVPTDEAINQPYGGHLNGGFSIRQVTFAYECCKSQHHYSHVEDSVFHRCRKQANSTATLGDAMRFASDNGATGCLYFPNNTLQSCPYGVHKPWKRMFIGAEEYADLVRSCPNITLLERLNKMP
jgi:hypothetical protein